MEAPVGIAQEPKLPPEHLSSSHQGHHKPDDNNVSHARVCPFPIASHPLLSALEGPEMEQVEGRCRVGPSSSLCAVCAPQLTSWPEREDTHGVGKESQVLIEMALDFSVPEN